MTMTLTYLDDLGRVEISLSGLVDGAVLVERSTNQLYWETVRGGTALPVVGGIATLDDYEFAANTLNHYRVAAVAEAGSITPALGDCEVWLKSVRYPLLNQTVSIADYTPLQQPGRVSAQWPQGRSFPIGVTDASGAYQVDVTFATDTAEQGRKLALSLAVGEIFYLQVPPDGNPRLPPRSMYVVVSNTGIARLGVESMRHITVSLQEFAKPAPQVVGTTLVWRTVFNTVGDWTQLINATPTWRPELATVGSPDDLVVI